MIYKAEGYKNGFKFDESTTNEDFKEAIKPYTDTKTLHCIICNAETKKKHFSIGLFGEDIITVNNKIADECFFVNGCY